MKLNEVVKTNNTKHCMCGVVSAVKIIKYSKWKYYVMGFVNGIIGRPEDWYILGFEKDFKSAEATAHWYIGEQH